MKKIIPLEVTDSAMEIYEEVLNTGQGDAVAVRRIQDLLSERNIKISDRTIFRYLEDWKKSGTIKSVIESFDVELVKPGQRVDQRVDYILGILTDELKKSVEKNEPALNKIRLADAMHKYIETEVKIEVLRGKKTTSMANQEQTARIVVDSSIGDKFNAINSQED